MGMTLVRMLPIAPYTLINLAFGMTGISYLSYIAATFFGLMPGITAKAIFGGAIGNLWVNPEPRYIAMAVGGLALWIFVVWATHRIARHYQGKMAS